MSFWHYLLQRGILTDMLSIEPVLSNPRSEDGIVAHKILKFNKTAIPVFDDDGKTLLKMYFLQKIQRTHQTAVGAKNEYNIYYLGQYYAIQCYSNCLVC